DHGHPAATCLGSGDIVDPDRRAEAREVIHGIEEDSDEWIGDGNGSLQHQDQVNVDAQDGIEMFGRGAHDRCLAALASGLQEGPRRAAIRSWTTLASPAPRRATRSSPSPAYASVELARSSRLICAPARSASIPAAQARGWAPARSCA